MALSDTTTLEYNGIAFPVTTETINISFRPVMDAAGRGAKYTEYSLSVRTKFGGGTGSNANNQILPAMRTLLEQPGRALRYLNKGFGDISVNTGAVGAFRDVDWGPHPTVSSWKPIGNNACEFTWSVTFAISDCPSANYDGILSFTFARSESIDMYGYATRTFTGTLEIPRYREVGGYQASFNRTPDQYREQFSPTVPPGFRRVSSDVREDQAKKTLTVTYTDVEYTAPLPEGVVECSVSQSTSNVEPMAFIRFTSSIRASYTMTKGTPGSAALPLLADLLIDRVKTSESRLREKYKSGRVIPISLALTEPDAYGKQGLNATFSWTTVVGLRAVLTEGMWRPIPGTNEALWRKSMEATAWHPRGNLKAGFNPTDDVLISMCDQPSVAATGLRGFSRPTPTTLTNRKPSTSSLTNLPASLQKLLTPSPQTDGGYFRFDCSLTYEPVDQTVVHMPLPTGNTKSTVDNQPANFADIEAGRPALKRPLIQFRGSPLWYVRLVGAAVRAGIPIAPPELQRLNGVDCVRVSDGNRGDGLVCTQTDNEGFTVYRLDWNFRYVLASPPADDSMYPTDSSINGKSKLKVASLTGKKAPPLGGF